MNDIALPPLVLNPTPEIGVWTFGQDNHSVFIVDNVLLEPEGLVDYATKASFASPPPKSFYPGLLAQLPDAYRNLIIGALWRPMIQVFGMPQEYRSGSYGFFALATVPPDALSPNQVAPHTDSHRLNSFATVHYLSHSSFGGTAFYRHKVTGLELVTPSLGEKFTRTRRQELEQRQGQPLSEISDLYEEIAYIEPRFNRLIFYRAGQIHAARIDRNAALSADPLTGRLTANLFYNTESI